MEIIKITVAQFKRLFNKAYPLLRYREFVGYKNNFEESTACYRIKNKLAGFAITDEKELVNIFNAEKSYKLLDDPDVVAFIKKEVNWLCCLDTKIYDDKYIGDIYKHCQAGCSISAYYSNKLDFRYIGMTYQDVGDMIDTKGIKFFMNFIKKYGIPHHVFLVNDKYNSNNIADYHQDFGSDGYYIGKNYTLNFISNNS